MIDFPVLWQSFWSAVKDMFLAVWGMPTWVYVWLIAAVSVTIFIATVVVR